MWKKYAGLAGATAVIIALIIRAGQALTPVPATVELYEAKISKIEETVSCGGYIESADSENVKVDIPCVVDEVYVKTGDYVHQGDPLFTLDVEATKAALASAGSSEALGASDMPDIDSQMLSPINGIVSSVNASRGKALKMNQTGVAISSGDRLQVSVTINENKLKDIKVNQQAIISGKAFEKSGYNGKVTYISPSARQQISGTGTETVVDAIVTLEEIDRSLKPGLSAKTLIKISQATERLVVPYEYIEQDSSNKEYVYIYKDGYAFKRVIETGKELSSGFEILSGLEPGENVIKTPGDIKKSGIKVNTGKEAEH